MKSQGEFFLEDLLNLLIERALEARDRELGAGIGVSKDGAFESGRSLAYYEVVSTVIHMALTFGFDPKTIPGLTFDPDTELLGGKPVK
jgi:hypothetical protein